MLLHKYILACAVILYTLIPFSLIAGTGPKVMLVSPSPHTMTSETKPEIIVRFDTPIDPTSVDSQSMFVFGRWTGVCPGTFFYEDNNRQVRFIPSKSFSAGEWITVSLTKKIRSAAGDAMDKGYAWNFWTASKPGSFDFVEISRINVRQSGEGQIRTYGAYAGDLNGDGFHDFTVPNEDASDIRVFLNDGTGNYDSFTIYRVPAQSFPSTNEGADFNGDGFIDFAVGNIQGGSVSVFFGDGAGSFSTHTTYPADSGTRGLCALDINGDGDVDIVTANRVGNNVSVLLNTGNGTFPRTINFDTGVGGETSCAVADANADGILDVFVGGIGSSEITVLLGDGDGNFSVSTKVDCEGDAWMIAVGDIDNDGHADVVSANSSQNQFALLRGDGQGHLGPAEVYDTGRFPLAIDIGDIDGDGDLDVVTSNFFTADWTVYENDGTGTFINPRTLRAKSAGSCAVLHDRDRDGDLDMTGIDEIDDLLFLFDNPASPAADDSSNTDSDPIAGDFELMQSYPNPYYKDPDTSEQDSNHVTIPFVLSQRAKVKLELFNLKGQRVEVLMEAELPAGRHKVDIDADSYPIGIYLYRLESANHSTTRKMIILR